MTNVGKGFKLRRAPEPSELVTCIHLVGDGVLLGIGDAVKLATGSISLNGGPVVQAVARAASGEAVYGVVVGCDKLQVASGFTLDSIYCPASTAMYILVKEVRVGDTFEIQEDGVGGSVATTNIGKNATMIVANADTGTGYSGTMLDSSTVNTTNTLDLCIRGFVQSPDNVPGSNAKLIVSFNNCQLINQATGV